MQCEDVRDALLLDELPLGPLAEEHVRVCPMCARLSQGLARLDAVLSDAVIVAPPPELQERLQALVAQPAIASRSMAPAATPAGQGPRTRWIEWLQGAAVRPQAAVAQLVALVLALLATWQLFLWVGPVLRMVGDVPLALQVLAGSPALSAFSVLGVDWRTIVLWTLAGLVVAYALEASPEGFLRKPTEEPPAEPAP